MNPIMEAKAVYAKEHCARTFEEDLRFHLTLGHVYSNNRLFMMGRPVDRWADPKHILNPQFVFKHFNGWLVWLAAGDLSEFFRFEPYELEFIGWERNNKLRWYDTKSLKAHVTRHS